MSKPDITALPAAIPTRASSDTFVVRNEAWLTALEGLPAEVNATTAWIENGAEDYSDLVWWIASTSYSSGAVVFDPLNGGSYRAKTSHSSATNPSADSTNWTSSGGVSPADQDKLDLISVTGAVDLDQLAGGKFFTADGAITAGETVVLKSDGDVAAVTSSISTFSVDTADEFSPATVTAIGPNGCCALGSDKFLLTYEISNQMKYKVATWGGSSWTFGAEGTMTTFNSSYTILDFDIDAGHGVLWVKDGSNNEYIYAFTVSGDVVSVGAALSLGTGSGGAEAHFCIGDGYVFIVSTGTNRPIRACTISGTTLGTLGTALNLDSGNAGAIAAICYLGSDVVAVVDGEVTTDDFNLYTVSRIGTTLTLEDSLELFNGTSNPGEFAGVAKVADDALAVGWYDHTAAASKIAIVPLSGGVTLGTMGSALTLSTYVRQCHKFIAMGNGGNFFASGMRNSDSYPVIVEFSYDGTTVTEEDLTVMESAYTITYGGFCFDPSTGKGVAQWRSGTNTGEAFFIQFPVGSTDADDWIGIAQATVADAALVEVAGLGDEATGLTGLVVDTDYYVADDGSLASSGTRKIGRATATTKLLVTEGNAA